MVATTTNDKTPAKPLSPAELAEELMRMADDAVSYKLEDELTKAKAAMARVQAKVDRAGERKLRILRARSVEEARAILDENEADENLRALCRRCTGWKPLQEGGGTDAQIVAVLQGWPDYSYDVKIPRASRGYSKDARDLKAWVDPDKDERGNAHLQGVKLVDAVRRVMNVPKPAAPKPTTPAKKKPAPAKKGSTKAPAPAPAAKATPDDGGGDDDEAGGAGDFGDAEAQVTQPGKHPSGDPNVNENGIYVRGVKRSHLPIPKGKRARVSLDVAKGADGLYRAASHVEWDSESGSGSGVNIESPGYPTEDAALVAEAEEIADGFRNLLKISNVSSGKKTSHRAGLAAVEAFIEKRKPAAEPEASAPPKPSGHRQTWGQWRATLQGVGGPDLGITVPDKIVLDEREQFFLERFRAGRRPAEARDAWKARQPAGGAAAAKPLPSVEALDHPQTPIDLPPAEIQPEPGHYYDADRFGVTPEQLAASLDAVAIHPPGNPNDGNPAPDPARIGRPLKIAGRFWAAVGASVEHHRVTYQLAPVVPEGETIVLYDNFDDLRTDHDDNDGRGSRDKAPEEYDLDGLGVVDPSNMRWVVARNEIYLRVPRDPETEARKLDPARAAKAGFDQARDAGKPFGEALQAGVDEIFKAPAATDDPAVDGRGVYVAGVREVWVTGTAKGDGAKVVIRVARGADGMYRTGHLLEFPGAQAWQADSDEPVKAAGQAAESEAYAIRARANILINRIKAAPTPGGKGGAWTAEQRRVYAAAIKALENFIAHNPAARLPGQAKAKAG